MAAVTATTAANLLPQRWTDVDVNTNEEMVHANKIKDLGVVNRQLNVPLMASIAASTLSAGSGSNVTFSANTEGVATFSPATRYAAVELEKQAAVRAADDLKSKYKFNLELSLASVIDADCLIDAASLTQVINAAGGIDKASALDALQRVVSGAKRLFKPGRNNAIGILHSTQYDEFMSISDFTSAQVRGDNSNPMVSGWIVQAAGAFWYESGNVYQSGALYYNPVYIKEAFGVGYNQRTTPIVESYQITDRIILWADFAHNIIRDAYAAVVTTP